MTEEPSDLSPEFRELLDRLPNPATADVDVEAALQRVKARIHEERRGSVWRTNLIRIAAAVVVVLGASLVWCASNNHSHSPQLSLALTYTTKPGERSTLRLADGSGVVLGPGSRLQVAGGYETGHRVVELNGEALFEVKHDAAHPFTVKAGSAVIRDVGTTFVVHSDPGEPVHVAVTAGSVRLHGADQPESQGILLQAGQHGLLPPNGPPVAQPETGADDMAFVRGELVFENASLTQVATELRRWYDLDLQFDKSQTNRHVTASFKGESPDEVLRVIGLALGTRIERNGKTAIVQSH